jgi:hypothetical protein
MTFGDLLEQATGNRRYPYQRRLVEADQLPELLNVPTGLGKTPTAILAWLWRNCARMAGYPTLASCQPVDKSRAR